MKLKKYNSSSFNRDKKNINFNNIVCINCLKTGHIHKNCPKPIKSFGIICLKIDNIDINNLIYINDIINKPNYITNKLSLIRKIYDNIKHLNEDILRKQIKILLLNRRNTISIIEFIRGKYTIKDYKYLLNLFYQMTNKEKYDLLNETFDYNWKKVWLIDDINNEKHKKEYNRSKKNYKLLKGGIVSNNIDISLDKLVKMSCNKYNEAEWGFPKGRKNLDEDELTCAKREFCEETNIVEKEYNLLNIEPLQELYMSINKIKYNLKYYISQYTSNKKLIINNNRQQIIEIYQLKWLNYYETLEKVRDYNIEKINIVNTIYYNIINLILGTKEKIENILI